MPVLKHTMEINYLFLVALSCVTTILAKYPSNAFNPTHLEPISESHNVIKPIHKSHNIKRPCPWHDYVIMKNRLYRNRHSREHVMKE